MPLAGAAGGTCCGGGIFCGMMIGKNYLPPVHVAGALVAVLASGVALGSYTVSGMHIRPSTSIIGQMVSGRQALDDAPEPIVSGDEAHVCTGCDAGLYRDRYWERSVTAYRDDGPVDGGVDATWQDEPALPPETRDEDRDRSLAAYDVPWRGLSDEDERDGALPPG